jgi:hypothetical protein
VIKTGISELHWKVQLVFVCVLCTYKVVECFVSCLEGHDGSDSNLVHCLFPESIIRMVCDIGSTIREFEF